MNQPGIRPPPPTKSFLVSLSPQFRSLLSFPPARCWPPTQTQYNAEPVFFFFPLLDPLSRSRSYDHFSGDLVNPPLSFTLRKFVLIPHSPALLFPLTPDRFFQPPLVSSSSAGQSIIVVVPSAMASFPRSHPVRYLRLPLMLCHYADRSSLVLRRVCAVSRSPFSVLTLTQ